MAQRLQDLFRMKLAKMREDSKARGMAFPFLRALSPGPEVAIPSTSSSSSSRERPSTSKAKKEPAPEVLEMRKQFKVVREQLRAAALAKRVRAEEQEKDRRDRKEEAEEKEAEAKAKGVAKELPSTNTAGSGGGRASGMRPDPWHRQTLVPQLHKTTAADLASKDRIRFMTYKDKCQLARDLSQLPEKKLGGMIRILRSREPKLKKVSDDKMEVNLDGLKPSTLWELKDYVTSCSEKKARPAAAGKAEGVAGTSKGPGGASLPEAGAQAQTPSESEPEWESLSSSDSDP